MGKAFKKQIKKIKDQGKKQAEVLKNLKPKEQTKEIEGKPDDEFSMQKETYNRLLSERLNEIQEISKEIDLNNLIHYSKVSTSPTNFIEFKSPFVFFFKKKTMVIFR